MSEETPCRYVEAFKEAKTQLEMSLESLLTKNHSELEETRKAVEQLVEREPERISVKERLEWLLQQEAKLQEALAKGSTCSRCKVLPDAAGKVLGCSNGHVTCQECHPDTSLSVASCSTCGEAVDKRSLLAVTVIGVIRRDCRYPGCLSPYHPTSASTHTCVFVGGEKESVTTDAKSEDPLLRVQQRVLELEVILKQTEKFHQEALGQLNKDLCPLRVKMEEVARLEKELQAVESKLTEGLECPVCWEVPTEGVLNSCPNGHLVCESCHQSMTQSANALCPSCRIPIGNSISLLATAVQQNIRHLCENTGCGERIPFQHVTEHRRLCPLSPENLEKTGRNNNELQECSSAQMGRLIPVRFALPLLDGDSYITVQVPVNANFNNVKKLFKRSTGEVSHLPVTTAQNVIQAKIYRAFCPT